MSGIDFQGIRSELFNRHVWVVYGVLTSFVIILQLIMRLGLDPFANIIVRILIIPGWIVMLGYVVLLVNVLPDIGQIGWLLGLALYLYFLSILFATAYRFVRGS